MDQGHSARPGLTDLVQTGLYVPVQQVTEGTHLCPAPEENVSMTVSVPWTEPVLTTTAGLLARMPVDRMQSVRQGTMVPSAPAHQDLLETLSLHADSQDDPRLMSLDSLDSSVTWTLTFYSFLRTEQLPKSSV